MTVYFIGAGPGDPELITVRGSRRIESCKLCLYAGSLVPEAIVAGAPARVEQLVEVRVKAHLFTKGINNGASE